MRNFANTLKAEQKKLSARACKREWLLCAAKNQKQKDRSVLTDYPARI